MIHYNTIASIILVVTVYLITGIFGVEMDLGGGVSDYDAIHSFLDEMQNPNNCSVRQEFVISDMGCGGGFAAHFQLAASQWMRAAKLVNFSMPVIIVGHIFKYSEGGECAHVNHDWTCFFEPMSTCQESLLKFGTVVPVDLNKLSVYDDSIIPEKFRHLGLAYWWGIVQERMFRRMQKPVRDYIILESERMNKGKGFPNTPKSRDNSLSNANDISPTMISYSPLAGVHVRHGDKSSDGFKHHSLEAEIAAVHKSPECIMNEKIKNVDLKTCWIQTNSSTHVNDFSIKPIPVFIASDDPRVLTIAAKAGHLVDEEGVSQQTAHAGMLNTLVSHPEIGYNASLEIIRDIYFLSRCSTLVGIAASQVFRMAVGISNATHALKYAAVMDYKQLPRISQMSAKYALPLPENFHDASFQKKIIKN